MTVSSSSVWSQSPTSITRTLPSTFVPPPPPPQLNQSLIQNVGSQQFIAFRNNMFAPLAQANNKGEEALNMVVESFESQQIARASKNARLSLLPESFDSSVRGLQFIQTSPLHSK